MSAVIDIRTSYQSCPMTTNIDSITKKFHKTAANNTQKYVRLN